jgi:chloramphenicol-sensitive protein RarD
VVAFGLWGVLPVYWKLVQHFGWEVVVCQRLVWTFVWLLPMVWLSGKSEGGRRKAEGRGKHRDAETRSGEEGEKCEALEQDQVERRRGDAEGPREWKVVVEALRSPVLLRTHAWSAFLLTLNWTLFIWAAQHGHMVECSLGYFLNPLLNVAIGRVVLGEHLSRWRKWSIALAGVGVLLQMVLLGHFPWIALSISVSFALYGLVRKRSPLGSLSGLAVESVVALPFALVALGGLAASGMPLFARGTASDFLLIFVSGAFTAVPLLAFGHAARLLRFSTLGLLQFLMPTMQFLEGAWIFGEKVTTGSLVSFVFIWLGVVVFCAESLWGASRQPSTVNGQR